MSIEHGRSRQLSGSAPAWSESAAQGASPEPTEGIVDAGDVELETLRAAVREVLVQGLHGLCFSPYEPGQGPGMQVPRESVERRLRRIAPYTRWVRSFSCIDGHEATPRLARQAGLKTLVGAWLGKDRDANRRELAAAIRLAREGVVDLLAVGNEVLLRGDLEEAELLDALAEVREAVPGVPVGYVDAYYLFEQHPRVTAACDVVLANCYPFWEGCPREHAVDYMHDMVRRVRAVAPGRPVLVAETGWPDRGGAVGAAQPSPAEAMRYFLAAQAWARGEGIGMFYFSAFDESWKTDAEGAVGACWGLWDERGVAKYV